MKSHFRLIKYSAITRIITLISIPSLLNIHIIENLSHLFGLNKNLHGIVSCILSTLTRCNSSERKQESLLLIAIMKEVWVKCHHNEVSSDKNYFLSPQATIYAKVLAFLISNLQIIRPAVKRKVHLPYFPWFHFFRFKKGTSLVCRSTCQHRIYRNRSKPVSDFFCVPIDSWGTEHLLRGAIVGAILHFQKHPDTCKRVLI